MEEPWDQHRDRPGTVRGIARGIGARAGAGAGAGRDPPCRLPEGAAGAGAGRRSRFLKADRT